MNQRCEILTGRLETGTDEQKTAIRRVLGPDAAAAFELYFHWYNLIHELAHLLVHFHARERLSEPREEQYVNAFAVAYWETYGEEGNLARLSSVIKTALGNIAPPAPAGVGPMEFFGAHWGDNAYYNFNDYGWFQFSLVRDALKRREPLKQVLAQRFVSCDESCQKRFCYILNDGASAQSIVDDAREILAARGLPLPPVSVRFIGNPEDHRINFIETGG